MRVHMNMYAWPWPTCGEHATQGVAIRRAIYREVKVRACGEP